MEKIFEVREKTGRIIYLPVERWRHIVIKHTELSNVYEDIKDTLIYPLFITQDNKNVHYYHRRYKEREVYLIVLVKYLNGTGFIISSYYSKKILP